jgi:hypothetical protein
VQETGLLEQAVLFLPRPKGGRRALLSAAGLPVGLACAVRQGPWWRRWLCPAVAIHEHEEQPLVFTVRRRLTLLPRRAVLDAEGEVIGSLAWPWLLDRDDVPLVAAVEGAEPGGTFRTPSSVVLATWAPETGGLRLDFHAEVSHDPFVKMLILAAVLHLPAGEEAP